MAGCCWARAGPVRAAVAAPTPSVWRKERREARSDLGIRGESWAGHTPTGPGCHVRVSGDRKHRAPRDLPGVEGDGKDAVAPSWCEGLCSSRTCSPAMNPLGRAVLARRSGGLGTARPTYSGFMRRAVPGESGGDGFQSRGGGAATADHALGGHGGLRHRRAGSAGASLR